MTRNLTSTRLERTLRRAVLGAAIAIALAGCHRGLLREHACNKRQAYDSATSAPSLRVPLGIDVPDTHAALRIPELNEPAPPPRNLRDPCLDEPPPFSVPLQPQRPPARHVPET